MIRCYIDDFAIAIKVDNDFTVGEVINAIKRHYDGPIDGYACMHNGTLLLRTMVLHVPEGSMEILNFISANKQKTMGDANIAITRAKDNTWLQCLSERHDFRSLLVESGNYVRPTISSVIPNSNKMGTTALPKFW